MPELSPAHQANNVTSTGVVLKDKNVRVKIFSGPRNGSLPNPSGGTAPITNRAADADGDPDWNLNLTIHGPQYQRSNNQMNQNKSPSHPDDESASA